MCIGGLQQDLILEDTQQRIKACNKYKYLGMYITNDGTTDETIRDGNIQGGRAINLLNSVPWDKIIAKANKHRIYNSIILLTQGSEVWQLKQGSENSLKVTEMDFWRRK